MALSRLCLALCAVRLARGDEPPAKVKIFRELEHHSRRCVSERGSSLVLGPSCGQEVRLRFVSSSEGFLLERSDGACVHPKGGSDLPGDGTETVFYADCSLERRALLYTKVMLDDEFFMLKHNSGKCLQPRDSLEEQGTALILGSCEVAQHEVLQFRQVMPLRIARVSSSWTPSSIFVAATLGADIDPMDTNHLETVSRPIRLLHVTDAHVSTKAEQSGFHRMHQVQTSIDVRNGKETRHVDQFKSALVIGRESKVDLVAIGGDLVNFPSVGTVSDVAGLITDELVTHGVPYVYTAGNHDWMEEGHSVHCQWEVLQESFLGNFASGDAHTYTLEEAQERCGLLGSSCAGTTCTDETHCTVRAGREALPSHTKEISHLKKECHHLPYDWQRVPKRENILKPLYESSGARKLTQAFTIQPDFSSTLLLDTLNVVALDNSNYRFEDAQLAFLEEQVSLGLPIVLLVHIPLYTPAGPTRDLTGTPRVGDPAFGEAIDDMAEIEGRAKWPKEASESTLRTVQFIRSQCAPEGPIIAVLCGHEHKLSANPIGFRNFSGTSAGLFGMSAAGRYPGPVQFGSLDGGSGGQRLVEVALFRETVEGCYSVDHSYWSYKLCVGIRLVQVHEEQRFSCGEYNPGSDQRLMDGSLETQYRGGTDGREATVILHCSHSGTLEVKEDPPKRYRVVARVPFACDESAQSPVVRGPASSVDLKLVDTHRKHKKSSNSKVSLGDVKFGKRRPDTSTVDTGPLAALSSPRTLERPVAGVVAPQGDLVGQPQRFSDAPPMARQLAHGALADRLQVFDVVEEAANVGEGLAMASARHRVKSEHGFWHAPLSPEIPFLLPMYVGTLIATALLGGWALRRLFFVRKPRCRRSGLSTGRRDLSTRIKPKRVFRDN